MAGRLCAVSRQSRADHHRQRGAGAPAAVRLVGGTVASLPAAARATEQPAERRRHPHSGMRRSTAGAAGLAIERKSIDYIPESERHGRVIHQAPFWFLGNFHFFTIAIGFVGPSMGLCVGFTSLAGTLGILFGTLFVAFHASQGAELGLPQMIQSRAQFGFRGVAVVLIGTLFTFLGFNVADCV